MALSKSRLRCLLFSSLREDTKENKKLPITLPGNYIAEYNEQWYPPLFSIILALVPYKWLHSYHWAINHILDFLVAF